MSSIGKVDIFKQVNKAQAAPSLINATSAFGGQSPKETGKGKKAAPTNSVKELENLIQNFEVEPSKPVASSSKGKGPSKASKSSDDEEVTEEVETEAPKKKTEEPKVETKKGNVATTLVSGWMKKSGQKSAETLAENIKDEVRSLGEGELINLVKMFKKIPLHGDKNTAIANENYKKAAASIKLSRGKDFNADVDLRIAKMIKERSEEVKKVGDKLYAASSLVSWDHVAIVLTPELRQMNLNCSNYVLPQMPDFLYCKAYFAGVTFEEAYFDVQRRFECCKFVLQVLFNTNPETGMKTIAKAVSMYSPDKLQNLTWDAANIDLSNIKKSKQIVSALCGAYLIDGKFLGQIKEVKKSKTSPEGNAYAVYMATYFMKIIAMHDWIFDGHRVEDVKASRDTTLGPTSVLGQNYWSSLGDIRTLIRNIKNKVLGKNTGTATANTDKLGHISEELFQQVIDQASIFKDEPGRGKGRSLITVRDVPKTTVKASKAEVAKEEVEHGENSDGEVGSDTEAEPAGSDQTDGTQVE